MACEEALPTACRAQCQQTSPAPEQTAEMATKTCEEALPTPCRAQCQQTRSQRSRHRRKLRAWRSGYNYASYIAAYTYAYNPPPPPGLKPEETHGSETHSRDNLETHLATEKEKEKHGPETHLEEKEEHGPETHLEIEKEGAHGSREIEKEEAKEKEKETKEGWLQLRNSKLIWMQKSEVVTKDEYAKFYNSLCNDREDFFDEMHFCVEGLEFRAMLFVPRQAVDLFRRHHVNLHACRALEGEEKIPEWLNFVKGVVDSKHMPPNILHDPLQQNKILRIIKKQMVKTCLEMFAKIAAQKDDYKKFYAQFGKCIKLGVQEDPAAVAELLRYQTSTSGNGTISFKEYVNRMKKGQSNIYCATGETVAAVSSSPIVKQFCKKGWEVLYMLDPIDELVMQHLKEFKGKKLLHHQTEFKKTPCILMNEYDLECQGTAEWRDFRDVFDCDACQSELKTLWRCEQCDGFFCNACLYYKYSVRAQESGQ